MLDGDRARGGTTSSGAVSCRSATAIQYLVVYFRLPIGRAILSGSSAPLQSLIVVLPPLSKCWLSITKLCMQGAVYLDALQGAENADGPLALPIKSVPLVYRGREWVNSKML